jgi:hypothetical protein
VNGRLDPARPTVAAVLALVSELYDGDVDCTRGSGIVGGHLHIVLDDGNTDASQVRWCLTNAIADGCKPCIEIADKMLILSDTQRERVYREHWQSKHRP